MRREDTSIAFVVFLPQVHNPNPIMGQTQIEGRSVGLRFSQCPVSCDAETQGLFQSGGLVRDTHGSSATRYPELPFAVKDVTGTTVGM